MAWMILMTAALVAAPDDLIQATAHLSANELTLGQEYKIDLEFKVKDGWSSSGAGIPAPLLQVDVPEGVELTGRRVDGYRALSQNEFIHEPYERLIKTSPFEIGFTLAASPSAGQHIGLNLLAYVSHDSSDDARFVRIRLELPVLPNANASPVPATKSDWGVGDLLQIGQKVEEFTLPRGDGSTVALKNYLGKNNIIVTTYRAFW